MDQRLEDRFGAFGTLKFSIFLACVAVSLTLSAAALLAASAPSFAGTKNYATGGAPRSIAIGDVTGDGKPDLATANGDANTVSVLANSGDGNFRARRDYQTGRGAGSVAIGDLNGDGKPDLATANIEANSVSVLANGDDGSFGSRRDYRTGGWPISVAIGDLNGDAKPDLAIANHEANTVSVLANRGDATFAPRRDYRTGSDPSSVAIGDLNGDGKPELVIANSLSFTVSVLLNNGDGSFRPRRDYATGSGNSPMEVAIGDLNGDSKPDLVTANGGNPRGGPASSVSVLANRGDGSFQARREYRTGADPEGVAIGDANGDGKPDLATANHGVYANGEPVNTVSVLTNRGDGRFEARLDHRTGTYPRSIAIGDLSGDGQLDLATANSANVSVLINTPGLCNVQNVEGQKLPAGTRTIARANCRIGKIRRAYSKRIKKGRVISQKPSFGTVLRGGGKVDLVVSRGRRRS
jgi:hypothetical protein